jgi:hypothetical protein
MRENRYSYFISQTYSTVEFVRCNWERFKADTFFCFTITVRRPILHMPHYTEYQYFLYETILKLREKGMTFNQIADHLNKKNILSLRGKKFRGGHVHSIMKRKRVRDEKLEREYPEVRSDFYLDVYDKSILFSE